VSLLRSTIKLGSLLIKLWDSDKEERPGNNPTRMIRKIIKKQLRVDLYNSK